MVACIRDKGRQGRQCRLSGCNNLVPRYIYALFDIRLWTVFYIGHSVHPYTRLVEHIRGIHNPKYDKDVYIQNMLEDGVPPLLIILDSIITDCRHDAEQLEIAYITAYRERGYIITGWEGPRNKSSNGRSRLLNVDVVIHVSHLDRVATVDTYVAQVGIEAMLRDMYGAASEHGQKG